MEQNYKERAARAERVASQLDAALAAVTGAANQSHAPGERGARGRIELLHALQQAAAALDQWAAHVDDYDTLDAAAAPCEHCGHPSSCTDYDPDPEA